ncbi:MAG: cell division ATP-binding protein FtsE [Calditrichaeota bacterium]|nr:cell division ATP-binding protein FtsE [Calditrichota bacterium]MCB0289567.1 cell division ATP-binding protein FtsE [Calditrichota bacterium]MCB9087192.1 cell division ATP-binding protein FtsE [Calditrichia bacterium]
MIELFNISIQLGKRQVLEQVSLKINKGEFVYLIGQTGSGKTTLLRLIYMDVFPDRGNVIVDSYSSSTILPRHVPFLRRKVGVIFQDFKLLPDRNVYDNIAFALQVIGAPQRTIKSRVLSVLTRVGLHHKRYQMPQRLSGGEQQRVAIARALVNKPFILLADEPTGNLDPQVARDILHLLENINRSGTAILMATHNYDLIRQYPHRTLVLENGNFSREINPEELA